LQLRHKGVGEMIECLQSRFAIVAKLDMGSDARD
jgi:hypothetical protein